MTETELNSLMEELQLSDTQKAQISEVFRGDFKAAADMVTSSPIPIWEAQEAAAETWEDKARWRAKITSYKIDHP